MLNAKIEHFHDLWWSHLVVFGDVFQLKKRLVSFHINGFQARSPKIMKLDHQNVSFNMVIFGD